MTAFEECTVSGFEELLRSAVENVVRNAVRFTQPGTAVDVSIHQERDRAVIRVCDRGPRVPEAMLSDIFLPFRRRQAIHGRWNDGSGLGLAIALRAVTANGGTIRAMNTADNGLIVDLEVTRNTLHSVSPIAPASVSPIAPTAQSFAPPRRSLLAPTA